MRNRDVMQRLRPFIGIPFVNGGRSIARGADCWGLAMLAYRGLWGIELPDYRVSCFATADINDTVDSQRAQWRRTAQPEVPCLVVMRIDPNIPEACNHLGVYVGNGFMLHTLAKQHSVLERIAHPYFTRKIEGFYAYHPG